MAQTRNIARGNARNAVMSFADGDRATPEQYADLIAFMRGKQNVTVRARVGVRAQGWAPGDDMSDTAECISLPAGGVGRLVRTEGPAQDATVLAHMVAVGRLDVLDDKDFAKAPHHDEVIAAFNKERVRQQEAAAMVGMDGHLMGIRARLEALEHGAAAQAE